MAGMIAELHWLFVVVVAAVEVAGEEVVGHESVEDESL